MAANSIHHPIQATLNQIWPNIREGLQSRPLEDKIAVATEMVLAKLPNLNASNPAEVKGIQKEVSSKLIEIEIATFWTENRDALVSLPIAAQIQIIADAVYTSDKAESETKVHIYNAVTNHVLTQISIEKLQQPNSSNEAIKKEIRKKIETENKTYKKHISTATLASVVQEASSSISNQKHFITYGNTFINRAIGEERAKIASQLWNVKNNSNVHNCKTPEDLWAALQAYPDLMSKILEKASFEEFTNLEPTSKNLEQIILILLNDSNLEKDYEAYAFIVEIANTSPENLNSTQFYHYLSMHLSPDQIEAILSTATQPPHLQLPENTPADTRRKYGMMVLAANYNRFSEQITLLHSIFGNLNEDQLQTINSKYSIDLPKVDFVTLSTDAKSLMSIGSNLLELRTRHQLTTWDLFKNWIPHLFRETDCWHNSIITPAKKDFIENCETWIEKAATGGMIIVDAMLNQQINLPMDHLHEKIHTDMKARDDNDYLIDIDGNKIPVPHQLYLDYDRGYQEIILVDHSLGSSGSEQPYSDQSHASYQATSFPGEYTLAEAGLALVKQLNTLAEGNENLKPLLHEVVSQRPQITMIDETEKMFRTDDIPISSLFSTKRRHQSTVIHKMDKKTYRVEYDYQIEVHCASVSNRMEVIPVMRTIRYTFDIVNESKDDNQPAWRVFSPTLTPLTAVDSTHSQQYKPNPTLRDEKLVYLRQEALSKAKGKEKEEENIGLGKAAQNSISNPVEMRIEVE